MKLLKGQIVMGISSYFLAFNCQTMTQALEKIDGRLIDNGNEKE